MSSSPSSAAPSVVKAYDDWHRTHEVDPEAEAPWYQLIKGSVRPDADLAGKRVLDIGCGLGGFTGWLARHPAGPAEVVGADFSSVAVEKARAFAGASPRVRFEQADIQRLAWPDNRFDTVFSCETIEHVPDPPGAVRELARVLTPGGRLYLSTPNYLSLMGLYRVYVGLRGRTFDEGGQPICHPNNVIRTSRWIRGAGLHPMATLGAGHYLPIPGRPQLRLHWLDRLGPLTRWAALHTVFIAEKR
jgi:2-polyprenyl-3-methyl-5-hydroxy-6-metoxy-1,4-benzoquinol methylase